MKAITLWQPWASLIAVGAKKYETRSWATNYRGKIAIHAAKHNTLPIYYPEEFKTAVIEALNLYKYDDIKDLPCGCILTTIELTACHEIKESLVLGLGFFRPGTYENISIYEQFFGDWTPGRYAWELQDVTPLPKPLPYRGFQRIWNVPDDVIEAAQKGGEHRPCI